MNLYFICVLAALQTRLGNGQQSWNSLNSQHVASPQYHDNQHQQRPLLNSNQQRVNGISNNLPAQVIPAEPGNGLGNRLNFDGIGSTQPPAAQSAATPLSEAQQSQSRLATKLLASIAKHSAVDSNVVISPFSIWAVALMLLQAAEGHTAAELANLVGFQKTSTPASSVYAMLSNAVVSGNNQGGFSSRNFLVRDRAVQPSPAYAKYLKDDFEAKEFPISPSNNQQNAANINRWIATATKGRVNKLLEIDDLKDLKVLLGNTAYFKGRWRHPFNISTTFTDQFKDTREVLLGGVRMMVDKQVLSYGYSPVFESQLLEIPYADGKTSMVVVLPKRNLPLQAVLNKMSGLGLSEIIPEMSDEEVELYLPKFKTKSDLALNIILKELGAQDIFNEGSASLPGLSNDAFVSKIVHVAEIENNEEGSTASAATGAHVSYKTSSVTFHANRPFIYFINDVKTRAILFAGTFTNPNII